MDTLEDYMARGLEKFLNADGDGFLHIDVTDPHYGLTLDDVERAEKAAENAKKKRRKGRADARKDQDHP